MRILSFFYFLKQIFFPNWIQTHSGDSDENITDATNEPSGKDEIKKKRMSKSRQFTIWQEKVVRFLKSKESISTGTSLFIHILIFVILAFLMLPVTQKWSGIDILGGLTFPEKEPTIDILAGTNQSEKETQSESPAPNSEQEVVQVQQMPDLIVVENPVHQPQEIAETSNTAVQTPSAEPKKPQKRGEFIRGGGFEGRTPEGRQKAFGNDADGLGARGEIAVESALQWIAAHQQNDGGWTFDFADSCRSCQNKGTHGSRIAATSLALLPFLGAGYTHQTGPYQQVVKKGLEFLLVRAADTQRGTSFEQGQQGMYSHGLATIVLCESFAMSRRKEPLLREKSQNALRFIEMAQNKDDGGWRYRPNEQGDLSASAWQIMALKSGQLARLHVSQSVIYGACDFLDSVAMDGGRQYRYVPRQERYGIGPDSEKTSTATGLLLRMYLGWEPGEVMLDDGIEFVTKWGPLKKSQKGEDDKNGNSAFNPYYAYYSTLAVHHYGGSEWRKWNPEIREFLIQSQSMSGHESGSWYFSDPHYCDKGGRLLSTALAVMILETPYRIMPLFRAAGE
ncbi:MAG: hypothetical protein ACRCUY_03280 [Thermoguttaceae bacterium]